MRNGQAGLFVLAEGDFRSEAEELATRLNLPLRDDLSEEEPCLRLREDGLSLWMGNVSVRGDFSRLKNRISERNLSSEAIVRAARGRGAAEGLCTDAAAGLGEDGFLLAAAGFSVILYERNPVIASLLEDALKRAAKDRTLSGTVGRMSLRFGDSVPHLIARTDPSDLIYLDPMFPQRSKTGAVKKKLQLIQMLEEPEPEEERLLSAAFAAGPKKIVVKRPAKGPHLAGRVPSYVIPGRSVRYDVYLPE